MLEFMHRFGVSMEYESAYVSDEVYALNEQTTLRVTGAPTSVEAVEAELYELVSSLRIRTVGVSIGDCKNLKDGIGYVKNLIDPAELRIRRAPQKGQKNDLSHPFYFVPNYSREVVLIGHEKEIDTAEQLV